MALAILQWQDTDDTHSYFRVNLGVNRYYQYAVGDRATKRVNGLTLLAQPQFVSPLLGPLADSSRGRTPLKIPHAQLDRRQRFVQIISYRTRDRTGPALSDIVEVPLRSTFAAVAPPLPALSFGLSSAMHHQPLETVPFAYKEVRSMDTAEALSAFSSALRKARSRQKPGRKQSPSSAAKPHPEQRGKGGSKQPTQTVKRTGSQRLTDAIKQGGSKLLTETVKQGGTQLLTESVKQIGTEILQDDVKQTLLANFIQQSLPQEIAENPAVMDVINTLLQSVNGDEAAADASTLHDDELATAQAVPALLAAKLATPARGAKAAQGAQALQGLQGDGGGAAGGGGAGGGILGTGVEAEDAVKLLNAVTDGAAKFIELDLKGDKQEQEHLENLLANAGDAAAEQWAYGAGLTAAFSTRTLAALYHPIQTVRLSFADVQTVMLNGRSRPVYYSGQDLAFPLQVNTPRPIRNAVVQLLVKHPETLEILLEDKVRVGDVTTGPLNVVPTLTDEQLETLNPNQDYLVCAVLLWTGRDKRTKQKKRLGTTVTQLITLVSDYTFDRIEGTGTVVPLNDVDRFRAYWHKVWEKDFAGSVRRCSLDCKYYLALEPERPTHARMETVTRLQPNGSTRLEGKLKTGLQMSPYDLNALLPQISDHPPLEEAELAALMTPKFQSQCSYAARSTVEFKGREGDTVGLWAYPEMKLQRLLLKQVTQTDDNGQVLELREHEVYFPMPAIVHFIGVGS